jgi:MarR family transcriptional regulator for hemolysin
MASTAPDLMYLFNQASHALNTEMTSALAVLGITARDHCVLAKAAEASRTQKEIAELALLDKTTMVVTVDGLEAAGLVRRAPCPGDRRARIIEVTPKGRKVVEASTAIIDDLFRGVLAALPATQRTGFVDALTRLVDDRLAEPPHVPNPPRRARTKV